MHRERLVPAVAPNEAGQDVLALRRFARPTLAARQAVLGGGEDLGVDEGRWVPSVKTHSSRARWRGAPPCWRAVAKSNRFQTVAPVYVALESIERTDDPAQWLRRLRRLSTCAGEGGPPGRLRWSAIPRRFIDRRT